MTSDSTNLLKSVVYPEFGHHLHYYIISPIFFFKPLTFAFLQNSKEDILKNAGNQLSGVLNNQK